jgi:maleylacetoacetate isomerase
MSGGFILHTMKLYNYFRSSASYRVRIALAIKGLAYDYIPVHLVRGEHKTTPFTAQSPDQLVPCLETQGQVLLQSMAIIEYLEETHPQPPLLPADSLGRAQVRALAQSIACEIHPLNNLRVLQYLQTTLGVGDVQKNTWYHHWVRQGLLAFEQQLQHLQTQNQTPHPTKSPTQHPTQNPMQSPTPSPLAGPFCFGNSPTMADCLLVPQIYNAKRFAVPLDQLPRTMAAYEACMALPAFQQAQPERCLDFVS